MLFRSIYGFINGLALIYYLLIMSPRYLFNMVDNSSVCRENGGLVAKAGGNTYNEYFISGALPTESCNAEPTTISVCNLATGKVESIKEDEFSESKYSKDTANCKAAAEQVCDLSTGKVASIDANEYDSTKYSRDTANSSRSEERRVGKECRSRWSPYH